MNPTFWSKIFDPKLTLGLIIIIVYLFLVALGNLLAVYNTIVSHSYADLLPQALSVFLYVGPAYGMLKLKNWARITEIAISILAVILGFFIMFAVSLGSGVFIIVTHGLIAIYLLKTECATIFRQI